MRRRMSPGWILAAIAIAVPCWITDARATDESISINSTGRRMPTDMRSEVAQQHPSLELLETPFWQTFELPPLDVMALRAADEQADRLRLSLTRDVLIRSADCSRLQIQGKNMMAFGVRAPDALGIRLQLIGMNIPAEATLWVLDAHDPTNLIGPIIRRGPWEDGEFLTPTMWTDEVVVLCEAPVSSPSIDATFFVSEVHHWYRDALGLSEGGACTLDATCYPELRSVTDATTLMVWDGAVCTGVLVDTLQGDFTPYVLTASHCVSNAHDARRTEFFFRYQADACSSGCAAFQSVAGATLIDVDRTSDHALLMIREALPEGVAWAKWSTEDIEPSTTVYGVHHPVAAPKSVAFGNTSFQPICGGPASEFMAANWTEGVTEVGSSGSGLFLDGSDALVGILTCGASSCTCPDCGDSYGRFSSAWNNMLHKHLPAGPDDVHRNNRAQDALTLPRRQHGWHHGIARTGVADWFQSSVPPHASLLIEITSPVVWGTLSCDFFDELSRSLPSACVVTEIRSGDSLSIRIDNGSSKRQPLLMSLEPAGTATHLGYALTSSVDFSPLLERLNSLADLDHNGTLDMRDCMALVSGWGMHAPGAALAPDADCIDVDDLIVFIRLLQIQAESSSLSDTGAKSSAPPLR